VFHDPGTTVSALYKAHLRSSLSNTSTTNSQRNLASGSLIYESGGDIWQQAGGAEVLLSDGSGTSSAPCVTEGSGLNVIYRKLLPNGSYNLYFRANGGGGWGAAQLVNTSPIWGDPHPVIGYASWAGKIVAFWEGGGGLMAAESPSWTNYSVSTARPYNPSITLGNSTYLFFTSDDGNDISIGWYMNYPSADTTRVPASIVPLSYSSQISGDGSGVWFHVVWEAFDQDVANQTVWYQGFLYDDWTAAHEFVDAKEGRSYFHPTVTHLSALAARWVTDSDPSPITKINGLDPLNSNSSSESRNDPTTRMKRLSGQISDRL
jgi:hypothetical protein